MGFPTRHQPRSNHASTLTSPKWGSDTQICRFSQKFRPKPLEVCYKVSLSKNFQRQILSQSTRGPTYRMVSTFWQGTPFPWNLGLKAPTPTGRMCVSQLVLLYILYLPWVRACVEHWEHSITRQDLGLWQQHEQKSSGCNEDDLFEALEEWVTVGKSARSETKKVTTVQTVSRSRQNIQSAYLISPVHQ